MLWVCKWCNSLHIKTESWHIATQLLSNSYRLWENILGLFLFILYPVQRLLFLLQFIHFLFAISHNGSPMCFSFKCFKTSFIGLYILKEANQISVKKNKIKDIRTDRPRKGCCFSVKKWLITLFLWLFSKNLEQTDVLVSRQNCHSLRYT